MGGDLLYFKDDISTPLKVIIYSPFFSYLKFPLWKI